MTEVFLTPSSSNIERAEYDDQTQELTVTFKSGMEYLYLDVPYETYRGLKHARSAGKYFIDNIKDSFLYEPV